MTPDKMAGQFLECGAPSTVDIGRRILAQRQLRDEKEISIGERHSWSIITRYSEYKGLSSCSYPQYESVQKTYRGMK